MNDAARNGFYRRLLARHVGPGSGVLEIGAGSGLLSILAARLGAAWVVAVEGSAEMAALARANVEANGLRGRVTILHRLSTELQLRELPRRADVLVSEIFGTLLLGESALDYIADVRERLLTKDAKIIPTFATQYAVPVECETLEQITAVSSWDGIDLSHMMRLQDTASIVFSKQYGFRLNSVPFRFLSEPVALFSLDFSTSTRAALKKVFDFELKTNGKGGRAHAWVFYWIATDGSETMSTSPHDTVDNLPRDTHWGQAIQLIDSEQNLQFPTPLVLKEGETYHFRTYMSEDRISIHIQLLPSSEKTA
ncbi:unnamed protein product [Phytomonas sp. Hart1]|nr:unnamed protein product [Phytomonas sp. Hart1]|eukprot:CCW71191.1 unnamed protein product [Phytomonas sp. isolate Hart1]